MTTTPEPGAGNISSTTMEERVAGGAVVRLQREFDGTFDTETIARFVEEAQERLTSQATISRWLPLLIERVARDRLRAVARLESTVATKPAVLFLCVHNAGRSQIAAGWMRHLAGDRVDVFSGGSMPAADTQRGVVDTMAEVGIDISTEYPKPWTEEVAQTADVIVSLGCGDACPIVPGTRYLDWDIPTLVGQPTDVLAEIRDDVRTRVEALIVSLDVLR